MLIFLSFAMFLIGFILILKGGDLLVESSVWFAQKTKISPIVVGATIVSVATTFPETVVSIIASSKGAETIAVNTAIGAMVCNFALVLGISFLIAPTKLKTNCFLSKYVFYLFAIGLMFLVGLDNSFGLIDAFLLFLIFVIFMVFNVVDAKKNIVEVKVTQNVTHSWFEIVLQFFVSSLAIGLGASSLVNNVAPISEYFNISESIIGMTVIAVGTNIPELVTTFLSTKQNNPELGIGNIFGASVINCTMLLPCAVFVSPKHLVYVGLNTLLISVFSLICITALISFPILNKKHSFRFQGVGLILLYVLYSFLMILFT